MTNITFALYGILVFFRFIVPGQECDCQLQEPLYKALGCTKRCWRLDCVTKYDCSKSNIIPNNPYQCNLNGFYYDKYEDLPGRYPAQTGSFLCKYQCHISSYGPFLRITNDCIPTTEEPPSAICPFLQVGFNLDMAYSRAAPLYGRSYSIKSECPIGWIPYEPVNYLGDYCKNEKNCCKYGDLTISKYNTFKITSKNATCMCMCPPYVACVLV